MKQITVTFTRAANTTAYTSGQVINGDKKKISIPMGQVGGGAVLGAEIQSSDASSMPAFSLYLFADSIDATDATTFSMSVDEAKSYIGTVDFTSSTWAAFSSVKTISAKSAFPYAYNAGQITAVLVSAGYTPISQEQITIKLHLDE